MDQEPGAQRPSGQAGQTFENASTGMRKRSPMMFAVVAACFLLPFVSFACSGQRVFTFSGLQLVTGAEVDEQEIQEDLFGSEAGELFPPEADVEQETERSGSEGLAVVALLAALVGIGAGFAPGRGRSVWSAVAAVVGALSLAGLKVKLDGDVQEEGEGIIDLEYRFGYWFTLLLFIALAVVHIRYLRSAKDEVRAPPPPVGPP